MTAAAAMVALMAHLWPGRAGASCEIANSNCYPWTIASGAMETPILEIIPNNAVTSVIYRVCLCPSAKSVNIVFRYPKQDVTIGTLERNAGGPVCRDYRIQTSRTSRLLVSRQTRSAEIVDGCYTAFPALP